MIHTKNIYRYGVLAAGAAALLPSCSGPQHREPSERPNIILINLDDAGNGDFSFRGAVGYCTPNIDRMAAEGMAMTNFYAAQPISGASRAGLMTGCYPNRVGFAYAPNPGCPTGINEEEETIAELLKDQGYRTAIFGKWHLGDAVKFLPLQHGFDEYYGLPYSNDMWPYHPQYQFPDLPLIEGNDIIGYNTDQTQLTTAYTIHSQDFIRRSVESGRPFFLYLAHSMPHVPLAVSDKFKGKSGQGLYGDVMMELDWSVGEIFKTLEETGQDKNTVVIFTSDNGPWANYGNHAGSSGGLREAKATTFNGGLKVPCLFWWKGMIKPGSICNNLMSNIDILPTVVELAGAKLPEKKIDGVSFAPNLLGETDEPLRDDLCFYYHKNSLEAVTDGMYKLVFPHSYVSYEVYEPGMDGYPGLLGKKEVTECELYDLRRDAGERVNVASQHPEVVARLKEMADRCRDDLGDDLAGIKGTGRREPGRVDDAPKSISDMNMDAFSQLSYPSVPRPVSVSVPAKASGFVLRRRVDIGTDSLSADAAAFLAESIEEYSKSKAYVYLSETKSSASPEGTSPVSCKIADGHDVIYVYNHSIPAEGFRLMTDLKGAVIEYSDKSGAFYASQMLVHSLMNQTGNVKEWPAVAVYDYPAAAYRGAMLDVSRHFFGVEDVKHFIDMMAMHRLNRFHWHLTDDQGWRVEIKSIPELTSAGAWRQAPDGKEGGYYTQDEIRELVAYAASKCIVIVPEIDMPGHSSAALAACPELGCTGGPYRVSEKDGTVHKDVMCPGKDAVYAFADKVIGEVAEMFPYEYIHVGGDEVPRDRWNECPDCQNLIRKEGLAAADGMNPGDRLQTYFTEKVREIALAHGRKIAGWDEILAPGLSEDIAVMSWRGAGAGLKAAAQGHKVVFSPVGYFYLNNYQVADIENEPLSTNGIVPMEKVYEFPLMSEGDSLICGVEACLWASRLDNRDDIDYQMLPRLAAFSEVAWSGTKRGDFDGFVERLPSVLSLYEAAGFKPARHYFAVNADYSAGPDGLEVSLSSPECSEIHYNMTGNDPSLSDPVYSSAIKLSSSSKLRAAAWTDAGLRSDVFVLDFDRKVSSFCDVRLNTQPEERYAADGCLLTDGVHSGPFHTTGLWLGYKERPLDIVIDLGIQSEISGINFTSLVDMGAHIMGVSGAMVYLSADGKNYVPTASENFLEPSENTGKTICSHSLSFGRQEARYVRVILQGFQALPLWHPSAGEQPFLFIDEIEVNQ